MSRTIVPFIALLFLLVNLTPLYSQIEDRAYLWTLNVGFATNLTNPISGNTMTGGSGGTTLEKMIGESDWSLGFNFSFFEASDEFSISNSDVAQSFSSYSLFVGTKYYVRSMGRWVPYFGFALGSSFSDRYTVGTTFKTTDGDSVYSGKQSRTSLAFAVPVGVNYFLSEDVFLGANLTSIWNDETFFKSKVNLLINLTLGFHIN